MSEEMIFKTSAERRLLESILCPVHPHLRWDKRAPRSGEICFTRGLLIFGETIFDESRLETALADFREFCRATGLGQSDPAPCRLILERSFSREEHEVTVLADQVSVRAADSEGIRRAFVWIEDEMLKRGGGFLPVGAHRRRPIIQTRLSRCFFGPINRPPGNRDELADGIDYYPEPYLNRLSHDAVNGLWITIRFQDTVPSRLFPEFAPEASRRLAKLQSTVDRCARYGIKIYVFCIEPESHPIDSPVFQRHPELKGHVIEYRAAFCTSTELGRAYLTEATQTLFSRVSGLGGMVVIPVGERFTHCSSISLPESGRTSESCNCPRCSLKRPEEVLGETLAALRAGMKLSAPDSEMIAWPYGQTMMWGEKLAVAATRSVPTDVILQHNFETGGTSRQLGVERPLWDYWLSVVGPSPMFEQSARIAQREGIRMSAKLQVGCSHEDATVPCVPVPGILHDKYQAMERLGVSAAMQSWYFGNIPSLMTRAAGLLSFAPFPENEGVFLTDLARREWQRQAPEVVRAWQHFRRAYENYPSTHLFGYYGPVQDGVVWPLHLIPKNRVLAPTWRLDHPVSGDYLPDCLSSSFTLREVFILCERMTNRWERGLTLLRAAFADAPQTESQRLEMDVAEAIGIQFSSTTAILGFYQSRERLAETTGRPALAILAEMADAVKMEIGRRQRMIPLFQTVPTLGYHSEAEGFKVTPALIRRGIRSLERLLVTEFPAVERLAESGQALFGEYTGQNPKTKAGAIGDGKRENWLPLRNLLTQNSSLPGRSVQGTSWSRARPTDGSVQARFLACREGAQLYFQVDLRARPGVTSPGFSDPWTASVVIDIEPRRLHPRIQFGGDSRGNLTSLVDEGYLMNEPLPFDVKWALEDGLGSVLVTIPLQSARLSSKAERFRFNLRLLFFNRKTDERLEYSWTRRVPLPSRQAWEDANPATDYAWMSLPARTGEND